MGWLQAARLFRQREEEYMHQLQRQVSDLELENQKLKLLSDELTNGKPLSASSAQQAATLESHVQLAVTQPGEAALTSPAVSDVSDAICVCSGSVESHRPHE